MASAQAPSTGKTLCRYFMSGCCKNGYHCTFSHDWKDKPDMVCRFYLNGSCSYGDKCRYNHVRPKEPTANNEPSPAKKAVKKMVAPAPVALPSLSSETADATDSVFSTAKLVPLTKDPTMNPKKWVQAPEFIPGRAAHGSSSSTTDELLYGGGVATEAAAEVPPFSYSDVASVGTVPYLDVISAEEASSLLCPFAEMGQCPFGETCEYLHGELCDMCNRQCLNPFDLEQQKSHHRECLEMHEREMERAFQAQGSVEKQCAICMEYIVGKPNLSDRRFGILSDCDHCFCLGCIRKWRSSTHSNKKTIRACPLCRSISYYVIPSAVWIDDVIQKQKLIREYKGNLSKKHCRHFNMGQGTCPFGGSCFYKHEYPDGTVAKDLPRFATNAEGESKSVRSHTIWEFLSERDERGLSPPIVAGEDIWGESSDHDDWFLSSMEEGEFHWGGQ